MTTRWGILAAGALCGCGGVTASGSGVAATGGAPATGGVPSTGADAAAESSADTSGTGTGGGTASRVRCPGGVLQGDFALSSEADVAALGGCTTITGRLTVATSDLNSCSLPALVSVGSLWVHSNPALSTFELPALTTVADDLMLGHQDVSSCVTGHGCGPPPEAISGNPALTSVSFPALASLRRLHVEGNDALRDFSLPRLEKATNIDIIRQAAVGAVSLPALTSMDGGQLRIQLNASLTSVNLNALQTIGYDPANNDAGLTVTGNGGLLSLSLPALTRNDGGIDIRNNGALTTVALPVLTSLGIVQDGEVFIHEGGLTIGANGSLTSVTAPQLAFTSDLSIGGNPVLPVLSLPALTTVGCACSISNNSALSTLGVPAFVSLDHGRGCDVAFEVDYNPALPTCQVYALRDVLVANGYSDIIRTDGNLGTCP